MSDKPGVIHVVQPLSIRECVLIQSINAAMALLKPGELARLVSRLREDRNISNEDWLINTSAVLGIHIARSVLETNQAKLNEIAEGD